MARNVPPLLNNGDVAQALSELDPGWSGSVATLSRSIEFAEFQTAVDFIALLAPKCEKLDHHPDLDLRGRRISIELSTHSAGGVTELDFALARVIDELAQSLPKLPAR